MIVGKIIFCQKNERHFSYEMKKRNNSLKMYGEYVTLCSMTPNVNLFSRGLDSVLQQFWPPETCHK